MIKFAPILLAVVYGLVVYRFSAWSTMRALDSQSSRLADPNLMVFTKRLAEAAEVPRIDVHIYEVDPVNGLATADGRIFLTRGFYNQYLNGSVSGEEIASVIAHELGHVALDHVRRRVIDFSGQNAIRSALAITLNRFLPGFGAIIAGFVTSMLAAKLSRVDEFEADAYATALLIKSGIGSEPQTSLLAKLDDLTKQRAGVTPAWLLSHPPAEKRIAAIRTNETKWSP